MSIQQIGYRNRTSWLATALVAAALPLLAGTTADAAQIGPSADWIAGLEALVWVPDIQPMPRVQTTLVLVSGTSEVVDHTGTLQRVSIADPDIADAVVVSASEVVINAKAPGQTTLLLWDEAGKRSRYEIYVTVDAPAIQSQLDRLMPGAGISAVASGNAIILSGSVTDPGMEERAILLATALAGDAQIINQLVVPDRGQVLLKVRFAEVNRSALKELGLEAYAIDDPKIGAGLGSGQFFRPPQDAGALIESSQDAVNFFLFHNPSQLMIYLRALQGRGLLRSLAEPTLMAIPGEMATFLAGGEFPYPVLQGGQSGASNAVTIQFKEFGIRLNFAPTITNSGAIRIHTTPEVSQLDFTQGLEISGFRIPALLTRRAETVIELSSGQTFAIAGLVDNSMAKQVNKVPLLGDIPILGALFRSEEVRQNRAELLVLVTPYLVSPADGPPPAVPTGEPDTWEGHDKVLPPDTGTRQQQERENRQ